MAGCNWYVMINACSRMWKISFVVGYLLEMLAGDAHDLHSTAMLEELEKQHTGAGTAVIYYFCDCNEPAQVNVSEIYGNLGKQLLSTFQIPEALLGFMEKTYSEPWLVEREGARSILVAPVRLYKEVFIVMDGLDECGAPERKDVLSGFHFLESELKDICTTKIWISSRREDDIERGIGSFHHISMDKDSVSGDISTYVAASIAEKTKHGELTGISSSLRDEIVRTLSNKSAGMFLWVRFQISDLCSEPTPKGIRETLRTLPKDLPETFARALGKIHSKPTGDMILAQKVFKWLLCANGLLLLDELREAVSIDVGDKERRQDKIPTDRSRLLQVCANLVIFDKDDCRLHFAHHYVREFLISSAAEAQSPNFYLVLDDTKSEIAHLCFTYLRFSDFQAQLVHVPRPGKQVDTDLLEPENIACVLISPAIRSAKPTARWLVGPPRGSSKMRRINPRKFGKSKKADGTPYPFLAYAVNNWLYCSEQDGSYECLGLTLFCFVPARF